MEKARFDKMLSNEEIRTMIAALGCGIGKEEQDPSKLRYHKIIIMTDADVDGSHIRTLLLTFFYRQMPFLFEGNHLYIAQPPLYKVKKGKEERYLKDEQELEEFIFDHIGNAVELKPAEGRTGISGRRLVELLKKASLFRHLLERMERKKKDVAVVEGLSLEKDFNIDTIKDKRAIQTLMECLETYLKAFHPETVLEGYELEQDAEHGTYNIAIKTVRNGTPVRTLITRDFILSAEFTQLKELSKALSAAGSPPFRITMDGQTETIKTFPQMVDYILNNGKKGLYIQRYKGLGEMNPEQLWETTMDPERRTLIKVTVEDLVEADNMFTKLMGDQVEPRRRFIEEHALEVSNLDI